MSSNTSPVRHKNTRKNRCGSTSSSAHNSNNSIINNTSPQRKGRKSSFSVSGNQMSGGHLFTFSPVVLEGDVDDLLAPIGSLTVDDIKKDLQQRSPSSPTPSCSSASSVSSTHSAESSPTTTPTKNNKTSMYEKVKDPRYKTELCKTFEERGECPYGNYCLYAHGASELRKRERHTKYKTELCWRFHTIGLCPYGDRCTFIHTVSPLKASPPTERLPVKSCERSTSKFEAFLLELAPS